MPRYIFEVRVAGTVRVRAADEIEARKVVPAVLLLPGPDEVRTANDANAKLGWGATISSVNFRVKGDIIGLRTTGRSSKSDHAEPLLPLLRCLLRDLSEPFGPGDSLFCGVLIDCPQQRYPKSHRDWFAVPG